MRADAPTCSPVDRLQDVRRRLGDWDTCFVLDDDGVLLGRLGRSALASDDDVTAEEAMTDGPSTIRPSARLDWSIRRMEKNGLSNLPVTTSSGRFLGLLTREDAEAATTSIGD
jgi:Mg/Co/Ni transporter MgtE